MPLASLPFLWLCPASWLPVLLSYENCVLIHGDFFNLRAACGTWNYPHSDFIQSNNNIWCYRNLIFMIISIYNSPSSSKYLHWRGISMEKVNLLKNVNFFCVRKSNEMPNCLCHYVALPSWALTALISITSSHVAMQMGMFTSWWRPFICPSIAYSGFTVGRA